MKRFPIKYRLASIILIMFVPLTAFSVYHYFEMAAHEKAAMTALNIRSIQSISGDLDDLIDMSFGMVKTLSLHPVVLARNAGGSDRLFRSALGSFPFQMNILAADMRGDNYGSAVGGPSETRRLNYADMDWFRSAARGEAIVGNLHFSKLFRTPSVMIAGPVRDAGGRQVGVLGMPLSLEKMRERILETYHLPPDYFVVLTDSKGTVLIDTRSKEAGGMDLHDVPLARAARSSGSGSDEGEWADGTRMMMSFATVGRAGWKVMALVPVRKAYHHAYIMSRNYIVAFVIVGLLAVALSIIPSSRISLNLSKLIKGLGEVERGNLSYEIKLNSIDELGEVADAFNRMAKKRRGAEEGIRKSESFLSSVLEGIGEGVIVIDGDYRIIMANKGYCSQVKIGCDEIIGRHCYELSHHRGEPCHAREPGCECAVKKCFETGEHYRAIHTHFDRDGKPIYVETNAYPLRDASGSVVSAVETLVDITEKKSLEAQLLHAQKMEAVGTLAGGVAHDFNNILTAIIGYATLLQLKMQKDDPAISFVENILSSSERAANLTQSLLAFSRKQVVTKQPVKVNDVIMRVERLLHRLIGEDINLRANLTGRDTTVLADAAQLEQVLMNLATNARDAMPDGGVLSIETDIADVDHEYVRIHGYGREGLYARITVSDTGAGMDHETQARIFEPFFTTKGSGKGTGLGLSIVYGIIKSHGGYINCYSEPGVGATFRIYLPLVKAEVAASEAARTAMSPRGTETVLLAEDNPEVRALVRSVLEDFGYGVIEAEDGEKAVSRFAENADRIDILLLDVIMPKKNGKEAYEEIMKMKPAIKAVFMSGYTADIIQRKGVMAEGLNLILKPVSPTDLLSKVREVLDVPGLPISR